MYDALDVTLHELMSAADGCAMARIATICSIVVFSLLAAACGTSAPEDTPVADTLPTPSVTTAPSTSAARIVEDDLSPCEHWDAALRSLAAGASLAVQSVAVERWLESVHISADSLAVGMPLVDYQAAVESLTAANWDFEAVDDAVVSRWVEGFLGNTLFGPGHPPVPRDECDVAVAGPDAVAISIDCLFRLEPAFTWLIALELDEVHELPEAEVDRLTSGVGRRWVDAGASPLCMSQALWGVSPADLDEFRASLTADEANRVAVAGAVFAAGLESMAIAADERFVEIEAVIP
ncbi:MAG: hypothetical protein R8F63_08050 [Acidimicrobiales bacterium]|nr:hypothetical protein [Acidimicrobiales bacterium]